MAQPKGVMLSLGTAPRRPNRITLPRGRFAGPAEPVRDTVSQPRRRPTDAPPRTGDVDRVVGYSRRTSICRDRGSGGLLVPEVEALEMICGRERRARPVISPKIRGMKRFEPARLWGRGLARAKRSASRGSTFLPKQPNRIVGWTVFAATMGCRGGRSPMAPWTRSAEFGAAGATALAPAYRDACGLAPIRFRMKQEQSSV